MSLTDAVTEFVEDAGLRWSAPRQIRYVRAVGLRDARGLLADTYGLRAAARLLLMTALASHRVDAQVVTEFREHYPTDADLIAAVAWGSCAAMRRTETWI